MLVVGCPSPLALIEWLCIQSLIGCANQCTKACLCVVSLQHTAYSCE